jgi:hypothetical protein
MIKMKTKRIALAVVGALLASAIAAFGANTTFFTSIGDQVFPFTQPLASGAPGTIDNMTIGATTKRPGTFTIITADTIAGAGINANFASPPPIGSTVPNTGAFTTASTSGLASDASLQVDTGTKTATATAGAATLNKNAGVITSEALTTAGLASYTLTLTDSAIAAADQVTWSVANGTNTQGTPVQGTATPGAGSVVIVVYNAHPTQALNGTLKIAFVVHKN